PANTSSWAATAPPEDLAVAYLDAGYMVHLTELAREGADFHISKSSNVVRGPWSGIDFTETLYIPRSASTADSDAATFAQLRDIFGAEIRKRGYPNVAGNYTAAVNDACKATNSLAALLIAGNTGFSDEITVTQELFKITLIEKPRPGTR